MFGSLGFTELILILVIVLIIFGAGKLPQLGEGVGKAIKGFKQSVHEAEAFDIDPQAQAQEGTSAQTTASPQIPQPNQTVSVEASAPPPQPAVNQPASPDPMAASAKA
ncbi:MAG: twin-arginine translocase TatA/TatE family subunit [Nitrospirales bacterium]